MKHQLTRLQFLFAVGFVFISHLSLAATINVTSLADADVSDSLCTLREAVTAAKTDAAYNGCTAGAVGQDVIQIPSGVICWGNALLIETGVVLQGQGIGATVLDGGNAASTTCTSPFDGRMLSLNASSGNIIVNDLTIQGGMARTSADIINVGSLDDSTKIEFKRVLLQSHQIGGGQYSSGVIQGENTTLSILNSQFRENVSLYLGTDPGFASKAVAIEMLNSNLAIVDSTFDANIVSYGSDFSSTDAVNGGVITYLSSGTESHELRVERSTFSNNALYSTMGDVYGGAIYAFLGSGVKQTIKLTNNTFSANVAVSWSGQAFGGAVFISNADADNLVQMSSVTMAGNVATDGGGFYYEGLFPLQFKNLVLANNVALNGVDCYLSSISGTHSLGYNFIADTTDCNFISDSTDYLNTDPFLLSLTDNGGPTETIGLDVTSLAIESGSCTDVSGSFMMSDQRGAARVEPCDRGAFETATIESSCHNRFDDDLDGQLDCDDSDCSAAADCLPESLCADGLDDDHDTLIDCADSDCASDTACLPVEASDTPVDISPATDGTSDEGGSAVSEPASQGDAGSGDEPVSSSGAASSGGGCELGATSSQSRMPVILFAMSLLVLLQFKREMRKSA